LFFDKYNLHNISNNQFKITDFVAGLKLNLMSGNILQQIIIFLGVSLVCVPIAKRLGLGSVIGYLGAGVLIGPFGLGLVGAESEEIMHASEFGVVMMLFLIGLELNPQSFWRMRKMILGVGLSQLVLTAIFLFSLLKGVFGFAWQTSLAISLAFAMSSTAIALQTLKEKGLSGSQAGKFSFAVLLLQDIAVIPILALLPLLIVGNANNDVSGENSWVRILISVGMIGLLVLIGKFAINPFLRLIAQTRMREMFTASALLIVIGVSYLMQLAGISAALGAFLAGVLLANSEYKHELESDVEPFKGLLMGVFFTAVGSTINFHLIRQETTIVWGLVFGVLFIKTIVLLLIGVFFKIKSDQNLLFAVFLSQIGEFAFVLLSVARQQGVLDGHLAEIGMAVTPITMAFSPLLIFINEKWIDPHFGVKEKEDTSKADDIREKHKVIIAGFGQFGSTVGRFLRANGIKATILDNDSDQVELLRKMGFEVYYGDCTRLDLLKSAGADEAQYLICTVNSEENSKVLAETVHKHFPHIKLFIRTRNRYHTYAMIALGFQRNYRETFHSAVYMGIDVLKEMGVRSYTATRKAQDFIRYDEISLKKLAKKWGNKERYIISVKEEIEMMEKLLKEDNKFITHTEDDNAWDSNALRAQENG